jgi:hypothetical protein
VLVVATYPEISPTAERGDGTFGVAAPTHGGYFAACVSLL